MTLNINISKEAEAKLQQKAAEVGENVLTYAAGVLERMAEAPSSLRDMSGPLADEFTASGLTDEQLGDLLEEAKNRARTRRRDET